MSNPFIKRTPTVFLQAVVLLIGIGALVFLLWEPHVEGVNANATSLYDIYFDDPFLAYAYTGSISFFVALYQAFMLLRYIGQNRVFSPDAVKALRIIKYCASILAALVFAALVYLVVAVRGSDDITGGIAMGLSVTLFSVVTAAVAAVFERMVRKAVDLKSENDLTV